MKAVEKAALSLAAVRVPVLLLGERGTGKAALAFQIHQHCGLPANSFIVLDPSRPEWENRLSVLTAAGPIEERVLNQETWFFRELVDIPMSWQSTLTSLLTRNPEDLLPRFIFASSRDLRNSIREGRLREDFYSLISGISLRLPPLRERKEDIPSLIDALSQRFSDLFGRPRPHLGSHSVKKLLGYQWPGNVGQLEDAMRIIVAVGDEELAFAAIENHSGNQNGHGTLRDVARKASRNAEKELIFKTLAKNRWNRRQTAQELKISYRALLYKLKELGYDEESDLPSGAHHG